MDKCFVATQLVAAQAMNAGLTSNQLSCHGLPIRPAFNLPSKPKDEICDQLGIDSAALTVMLIGEEKGSKARRLLKLSQKRPVLLPSDHMCATSFAYRDRILLVEWLSSEVIFFTSIDHNMWSEY